MVTKLVEVIFTEEDRNNLKTLTKEVPKLRSIVESLIETIEILGDEELLKELDINENQT
jgi:hypothetical protein